MTDDPSQNKNAHHSHLGKKLNWLSPKMTKKIKSVKTNVPKLIAKSKFHQRRSSKSGLPKASQSMFSCLGSFSSMSAAPEAGPKSNDTVGKQQCKSVPVLAKSGQQNTDNTVRLNVYGLTSINQVIRFTGLGVYHSGVEVYGVEWAYGGYPYPVSSIFRMREPRDLASLSDINGRFQFVESIVMGRTKFTYEEIKLILTNLGKTEWIGTKYHLLYHNCNCFTDELCKILCNKPIPPWVNRLASIATKFPYLIKMIPDEFFTPVALQDKLKCEQELKYKLSKGVVKIDAKQILEREREYIKRKKSESSKERIINKEIQEPSRVKVTSFVTEQKKSLEKLESNIQSHSIVEKSILSLQSDAIEAKSHQQEENEDINQSEASTKSDQSPSHDDEESQVSTENDPQAPEVSNEPTDNQMNQLTKPD